MKKKIIFLVALCIIFTSIFSFTAFDSKNVMAAPAFQRINYVDAVVTGAEMLNVRQGPGTNYPIVCVLKKGQAVKVFGKIGDWYAVYEAGKGCVGCVSSAYIKAPQLAKTPAPAQKPPAATPAPKPGTAKPTPTVAPPKTTTPQAGVSQDDQTLLDLVNKARADAGLSPLAFDMKLMDCARAKAKDMVDNNYFSHQSPTYGSPFDMMRQFDISFKTAGENIAGNQTVQGAFNAWMNSEGHRKNILSGNFNYIGLGIVSSPTYGKVLVQQFIGR